MFTSAVSSLSAEATSEPYGEHRKDRGLGIKLLLPVTTVKRVAGHGAVSGNRMTHGLPNCLDGWATPPRIVLRITLGSAQCMGGMPVRQL